MVALHNIDKEPLPNRCVDIKTNIANIEFAQWITGYHDEENDEYYDLLKQKSNLMDCKNKNRQSNKYLRRDEILEKNERNLYLHNAHCPELNHFLSKHKYAQKSELTSTQIKLLLDVKRQANELACEHKMPFVDYQEPIKK